MSNTRIPYQSAVQLSTEMIPAAGNDALPPQSTTSHSAMDIPLHVQFATASSGIGIVRGEKNW